MRRQRGTGPMQTALRETALQDWTPSSMSGFNMRQPLFQKFKWSLRIIIPVSRMQNEQYAIRQ